MEIRSFSNVIQRMLQPKWRNGFRKACNKFISKLVTGIIDFVIIKQIYLWIYEVYVFAYYKFRVTIVLTCKERKRKKNQVRFLKNLRLYEECHNNMLRLKNLTIRKVTWPVGTYSTSIIWLPNCSTGIVVSVKYFSWINNANVLIWK